MTKNSGRINTVVVLTGAGISQESGIETFRAEDGLWAQHRVEDVATPEGFSRDPKTVYAFYNARRRQLLGGSVQPNAAHRALADFEANFAGNFLLITQNIDDLHERGGSTSLIHMHGELLKSRCQYSAKIFPTSDDIDAQTPCPCCQIAGALRPHVVWFGEMPLQMDAIYNALQQCDLFVAIGTSGQVYPAADFHREAKQAGAHTVELNLEKTTSAFDERMEGKATQIVPKFFSGLFASTQ